MKMALLDKGIKKFENCLLMLSIVMLFILMFLGSADVLGRYIFNRPIIGAMEWSQVLMAGIIILCWGYVQATGSNIRLDLVIMKYPPRAKAITEIVILIITLLLFGVVIRQSTITALQDLSQDRIIETILIPSFPFKLLVPFGSLLICLESISQIAHLVRELIKKEVK